MKKILALTTAALMSSVMIAAAQGNSGNSMGGGASEAAPGQVKKLDGQVDAMGAAPGQLKDAGESAAEYAPGQQMKDADAGAEADIDSGTTASTGNDNFGKVISSIRAGKSDLSGVDADTKVNVMSVDDLIEGNNRSALDNALDDNRDQIDQLRADLGDIDGLEGLTDEQIDAAVAARVEADGSLTVYTDD